jgi:hypothetical protein
MQENKGLNASNKKISLDKKYSIKQIFMKLILQFEKYILSFYFIFANFFGIASKISAF